MKQQSEVQLTFKTREAFKFAGVVLLCYLGFLAFGKLQKPLILLTFSLFFAIALNPPISKLAKLLPNKSRVLGTAISYLLVITMLGGFLSVIIPPIAKQSSALASRFPSYIEDIRESRGPIGSWVERNNLQPQIDKASESFGQKLSDVSSNLLASTGAVFGFLGDLLTVLILTFLMLIEGPTLLKNFWGRYKNKQMLEDHQLLAKRMYKIVTSYFNGQVLIATINGVMAYAVMNVVGLVFGAEIPYMFALAAAVFIFGLIPMIGNFLGAASAIFVALFVKWQVALAMAIYFFAYQQIENATIQPAIHGRSVSLSPLMILIVMLCSVAIGGTVAAFLALPIAGCLQVLIEYKLHLRRLSGKENSWFRLTN